MTEGPGTHEVIETLAAFTQAQVDALARGVRDQLADLAPGGVFSATLCRHVWDEYCWNIQEGPADSSEWSGGRSLGSFGEALDDLALTFVEAACADLPQREQRILQAARNVACFPTRPRRPVGDPMDWDADDEEEEHPGADVAEDDDDDYSLQDYMADLVLDRLSSMASRRKLELIGPDRGSELSMEVSWGSGWIPEALDDVRCDLVERHADALIDADGDISDLVEETVENLWLCLYAGAESAPVLREFMASHENDLREIIEGSVRGTVQDMRSEVAWLLDREG